MSVELLAAFWAVSILFIITPGADWAYAISAGLQGRVIPAVSGLLLGHLCATLLIAVGVGALIMTVPFALTALTVFGSTYLFWLGIGLLRHPPVASSNSDTAPAPSSRWIAKGFGVSGLNPKVLLLFLALLPQFADPRGAWPVSVQMSMLGLIHVGSCGVVYLLVSYGSKAVLSARPNATKAVGRVSGALMIAIAAALLAEQFFG